MFRETSHNSTSKPPTLPIPVISSQHLGEHALGVVGIVVPNAIKGSRSQNTHCLDGKMVKEKGGCGMFK